MIATKGPVICWEINGVVIKLLYRYILRRSKSEFDQHFLFQDDYAEA